MTMVCNNCLQEILAGESFWEDETEGTVYHKNCRQAALDRRNKAEEERDAASARVEAAEAEAVDLHRQLVETATAMEEIEAERLSLAARVAELESQLAAQGWRPVTEKPDKPGWYVVYDSDGHVFYNADIFPYRVARWTGKWDSAFNGLVDYWRPLPPAPQETE